MFEEETKDRITHEGEKQKRKMLRTSEKKGLRKKYRQKA